MESVASAGVVDKVVEVTIGQGDLSGEVLDILDSGVEVQVDRLVGKQSLKTNSATGR